MKLNVKKASTDVTLYVFIQDSTVGTGAGKTGLAFNTASLVAYYVRPLGSATALSLATQTVTGAHSDGGFVEIDATNMPGVYRLDLSDVICATGVNSVVVMLKGASGMAPVLLEIQLVSYDPNSATDLGLSTITGIQSDTDDIQTRLPAALVSGRMSSDAVAISGSTSAADEVEANIANLDATVGSRLASASYTAPPSAATIAQAVWDALTSALTTVGSIGKKLADWTIGSTQTGDAFARLGAPAGASVSADIAAVKADTAAIKTKTDSLTYTVAGQVDANIQYVNDTQVTGDGESGTEWGPV